MISTEVISTLASGSIKFSTAAVPKPTQQQESIPMDGDAVTFSRTDRRLSPNVLYTIRRNILGYSCFNAIQSPAAKRFYRRQELNQIDIQYRQVKLGRPDPNWRWCNDPKCDKERALFERPYMFHGFTRWSRNGLLVRDYIRDFASAMVDGLYPLARDGQAKRTKRLSLEWFIKSPPVVSAFWYFKDMIELRGMEITETNLQQAIDEAQPQFLSIKSDQGSKENIDTFHNCSQRIIEDKDWTFANYVLRFMLHVEAWRQYGKWDCNDWSFGTNERAAEFLAALLYNFCIMRRDKCFYAICHTDDIRWDETWEKWLGQNPMRGMNDYQDSSFVLRETVYGSEQKLLEEVGYLGGVGSYVPVYTQRPKVRGKVTQEE